ncbi:MAG TPA: ABC transporter substrate-binding protein, partial [Candidatus Paceibacterota bacterium]|nr:ABC transporter substrate-binding protein [Candidatus Paceibacterota bacterium]
PPLSTDLINLVEGMYVTDFKFDLNDPQVKAYVDEYHRQFGEQRVYPNSALEYGVAQIIAQTVKQCGDDVECMKQTMSSSTYDTILGKVRFDEYGNAIPPAVLKHVENGKEVIVLE